MAERQGWSTWTKFKEAGIVDEHVNFSDEKVIIDHALGKTKQTIGECWPMDAAVAYTLAAAGPSMRLTSMEMVNQYTRMAAVMMSQKVAYGEVPDPNAESCGHDEVNAMNIIFGSPRVFTSGGEKHIYLLNAYNETPLTQWLERRDAPEEIVALSKLRVSITSPLVEDITHARLHALFTIERFTPLRQYIERWAETTKWRIQGSSSTQVGVPWTTEHTFGECQWADDEHTACAHHDRPKIDAWVLIKEVDENGSVVPNRFCELWSRRKGEVVVSDGWNWDQLRSGPVLMSKVTPERVVLFDNVKRNLANQMDEKRVRKEINASLRRMLGRNLNCVTKEGIRNTATYQWKNWSWLNDMQAWVAQTSKKNRKEGDVVQGWNYTKYESRKSFGHEIAKFKWVPDEAPSYWTVAVQKRDDSYWSYRNTTVDMPFSFPTEDDAFQFLSYLLPLAGKCNADNVKNREWYDGRIALNIQTKEGNPAITVDEDDTVGLKMEMDMNKDPEGLPTPQEMHRMICFGTPQEFDEAVGHLVEPEQYDDWKHTLKEAEGDE